MTRPLVLHFIETGVPGGAERFLVDLCRHQMQAGLQPLIAHFSHPYFLAASEQYGIESVLLTNRSLFKRRSTIALFAVELARIMRKREVRLLHSHLFGPVVGGAVAAFLAKVPHVGTLHDVYMLEDKPSRVWQLRMSLMLGSKLVAVSRNMLEFYRGCVRWRCGSIVYIPNGTEPPAVQQALSRKEFSIAEGAIVVVLVGRLVPLKRTADALRAFASVKRVEALRLLVVGDGPELDELRRLATALGIANRVDFLGRREDVPSVLALGDIFLQCSETEGLSMSLIEALHAGLPCVVTRVGGNSELVRDGKNGVLCEAGNVAEIAAALEGLAGDPMGRVRMSDYSREIAENYTMSASATKYSILYGNMGIGALRMERSA